MKSELEKFIEENKSKLVNGIGESPDKAIKDFRDEEARGGTVKPLYSSHGTLKGFFIPKQGD